MPKVVTEEMLQGQMKETPLQIPTDARQIQAEAETSQQTEEGTEPPVPEADAAEPQKQPEPERKYMFDDLAAAEQAYRQLQSKTTSWLQERSEVEKELNRLRSVENEQLKKKRFDEFQQVAKDSHKEVIQKVKSLDPEDPGYDERVSDVWAEYQRKLMEMRYESDQTGKRTNRQTDMPETQKNTEIPVENSNEIYRRNVFAMVSAAGLDVQDPEDMGVFQKAAMKITYENQDGTYKSIEQQTREAIAMTKLTLSRLRTPNPGASPQPMGRGGSVTKTKEPPKIRGMGEIMDDIRERRRL